MEFDADQPLDDPQKDAFQRFMYAQNIAKSITNRKEKESLVIGINGSWGEGKTTVLKFISQILKKEINTVVVKFNPWIFSGEDALLAGFFNQIALEANSKSTVKIPWIKKALRQKKAPLLNPKEIIAKSVSSFGKGANMVYSGLGETLQAIANNYASVNLHKLKERLNQILLDSNLRFIIIIDDIDRLADNEIHSILRLVKLTADFHNTTYILSFDEKVVSRIISQRYTANENESGFLEKIIQVPLKLPKANVSDISLFCLTGVEKILDSKGIKITEQQGREFFERFSVGILPMIKTPRMAIRYWNSLNYAIEMLEGEVNIVDLLTVEAIKVLKPGLYEFIQNNKSILTESHGNTYDGGEKSSLKDTKEQIEKVAQELGDTSNLMQLLLDLFPLLREIYENKRYPPEFVNELLTSKRISSSYYFDRYFTLGVLKNQISDRALDEFLNKEMEADLNHAENQWDTFIKKNQDEFLTKLLSKEKEITWEQTKSLYYIVSHKCEALTDDSTTPILYSLVSKACLLLVRLSKKHRNEPDCIPVLKNLIETGISLDFIYDFIKFLYPVKSEMSPLLSIDQVNEMLMIWVNRFLQKASGQPIFVAFPKNTYSVLSAWASNLKKREEVKDYIRSYLDNKPNLVFNLLESFTPYFHNIYDGKNAYGDFNMEAYKGIKKVIEPDYLYSLIEENFHELTHSEPFNSLHKLNHSQTTENIVKQFCNIHKGEQESHASLT